MKTLFNVFLPWLILREIAENQERIIEIMSANQDKINALTTKVDKIITEIEALKAQPGAEELDFSGLEAAINTADELNPDAPETVEGGAGGDVA